MSWVAYLIVLGVVAGLIAGAIAALINRAAIRAFYTIPVGAPPAVVATVNRRRRATWIAAAVIGLLLIALWLSPACQGGGGGGEQQPSPTPAAGKAVVAYQFFASPPVINSGQSSKLSWKLPKDSKAVSIDLLKEFGNDKEGDTKVAPKCTTAYTLRWIDAQGNPQVSDPPVTVTVRNPVTQDDESCDTASPDAQFVASPPTITVGQETRLVWSLPEGARTVSVDGVGNLGNRRSGDKVVKPECTTSYTLHWVDKEGRTQSPITATVAVRSKDTQQPVACPSPTPSVTPSPTPNPAPKLSVGVPQGPDRVQTNSRASWSVMVVNSGATDVSDTIALLVNGDQKTTQSFSVKAGDSQSISLVWTPTVAGTVSLTAKADGTTSLARTVVLEPAATPSPTAGPVATPPPAPTTTAWPLLPSGFSTTRLHRLNGIDFTMIPLVDQVEPVELTLGSATYLGVVVSQIKALPITENATCISPGALLINDNTIIPIQQVRADAIKGVELGPGVWAKPNGANMLCLAGFILPGLGDWLRTHGGPQLQVPGRRFP